MAQELDEMREKIAEVLWTKGKPHTRFFPLKSATTPYWKGTIEAYMEFADKILSQKTANGYSIQQMIEFFGEINRDTQREAVVKRKVGLLIENSDVEAMYAGIFNATFPSLAGANEVVVAERVADAMKKYKSRLLAKHFVQEVPE